MARVRLPSRLCAKQFSGPYCYGREIVRVLELLSVRALALGLQSGSTESEPEMAKSSKLVAAKKGRVLLVRRKVGMMHLVCYVRDDDRVFETWWTTIRGVEAMDNSYSLMDLTVYGRQEAHEDSPAGWPQPWDVGGLTANGRPISHWSRLEAGRSDDIGQVQ